ncbi:MAG: hypothetical protein K2N44_09310, partial [Lachnospiraceae bacterium]|nr:hypothetical protein [Lachnospiraceae bacterium]
MLSLEGGELNMFGSYTMIRTTQRDCYPLIHDEPTGTESGEPYRGTAGHRIGGGGSPCSSGGGSCCDRRAGNGAFSVRIRGAAIGAGAAAIGTAVSDSETGYSRSWGEYW